MCNDIPGRVEEWHSHGKDASECTTDRKHRPYNNWAFDIRVLATFLGFRKPLYSLYRMCHTSTHPGTSLHMTQAFAVLVLQATNAGVRRTGYKAMPHQFLYLQHCSLNKVHIVDAAIGDCTLDGQLSMRPFSLQIWLLFPRASITYNSRFVPKTVLCKSLNPGYWCRRVLKLLFLFCVHIPGIVSPYPVFRVQLLELHTGVVSGIHTTSYQR